MAHCSLCRHSCQSAIYKIDIHLLHKECMNSPFPYELRGSFFHYGCFILKYKSIVRRMIRNSKGSSKNVSNKYVYHNLLFTYNSLTKKPVLVNKKRLINKSCKRVLFPAVPTLTSTGSLTGTSKSPQNNFPTKYTIEEIYDIISTVKNRHRN